VCECFPRNVVVVVRVEDSSTESSRSSDVVVVRRCRGYDLAPGYGALQGSSRLRVGVLEIIKNHCFTAIFNLEG